MQDERRITIANAFSRGAKQYDNLSGVQVAAGAGLLGSLTKLQLVPTRILDAGCGTGILTEGLVNLYPQAQLVAVDFAPGMLHQTRKCLQNYKKVKVVSADLNQSLKHLGHFDLIFSNFTLHWCSAGLPWVETFSQLLCPGGLLAVSMPVTGSLAYLQRAWSRIDGQPHVNQFPSSAILQDALLATGFELQYDQQLRWLQYYPDILTLMRALKAMGAHRVLEKTGEKKGRSPLGLRGRQLLSKLAGSSTVDPALGHWPLDYCVWQAVFSNNFI